jgi:hypothetical protein
LQATRQDMIIPCVHPINGKLFQVSR